MREVVILIVPRMDSSGPVKGAIALHNALKSNFETIIIPIYSTNREHQDLNICYSVSSCKNIFKKFTTLHQTLHWYGQSYRIKAVFTFCIQPDLLFSFSNFSRKVGISSIRANNWLNYKYSFGKWKGPIIAFCHYLAVGLMYKKIILMNSTMPFLMKDYLRDKIVTIPNFIDEDASNSHAHKEKSTRSFQVIYVGGLTKRKSVDILIRAVSECAVTLPNIRLLIVGDGPEMCRLKTLCEELNIANFVEFHGHLDDPLALVKKSDLFVLPSRSEGTPRAAMEALFSGVPVVLRDIDSNSELIIDDDCGSLFQNDEELAQTLIQREYLTRKNIFLSKCLLPEKFWAHNCINEYLKLIESLDDEMVN